MADMNSRYGRISDLLAHRFSPARLEIEDESAKHAGHAAQKGVSGGQTHYRVVMVSAAFTGMSRLARARAVHVALDGEFKSGLHALSLTLQTPGEADAASRS